MCITKSVGNKGKNNKVDLKVIQAALNLSQSAKFTLDKKLTVNGRINKSTIAAIESFQSNIVGISPDGRVDPDRKTSDGKIHKGKTLSTLKSHLTKGINDDALIAIMSHGNPTTIKTYLPLLKTRLPGYQINSPLRIVHFLAQLGHESLSFIYTEEIASGAAYEGRKDLGNTETGDGIRFKGRGLIQLTGRKNYTDYADYACLNILKKGNEKLISLTPSFALDVSLWFWKKRKLNTYADHDDLRAVTRRVNGGYNGINDRESYLCRAKYFIIP